MLCLVIIGSTIALTSGRKVHTINGRRTCTRCDRNLPISEFPSYKTKENEKNGYKDGIRVSCWCHDCKLDYDREWKRKNPDKVLEANKRRNNRKHNLKKKYNLTEEDVRRMNSNQNGICALCKERQLTDPPYVDHDHETGAVRELLCVNCNAGLGNFKENISFLKLAIEYLKKHAKRSGACV